MKSLVIDAYDSFVYIIVQYLKQLGMNPTVVRNDQITPRGLEGLSPDMILLGPGPGHPRDAGYIEIIHQWKGKIPILGVCLGHQAIGLAFGADVIRASHLMHGKESSIQHDGKGCFSGMNHGFLAMRYHSLILDQKHIGDDLEVSATAADDGYVMGIRHRQYPIEGVQFHPESIGTESGLQIFDNFRLRYLK
ncbi:MAG TPA: aminodeoxychorismate/anthranilate synthase component II [Candidatus Baltobacteraceae bacterium]|nr:aminodeoxychorismate/anthranilate synthase component II [Candidatus Baltobacteraceae bacterium]